PMRHSTVGLMAFLAKIAPPERFCLRPLQSLRRGDTVRGAGVKLNRVREDKSRHPHGELVEPWATGTKQSWFDILSLPKDHHEVLRRRRSPYSQSPCHTGEGRYPS